MNILRRYFYWTYERGSLHYDVMVTFILAFIFITPHLWNYKDKPAESIPLQASQVLVRTNGAGNTFIYEIPAVDLPLSASPDALDTAILRVIEPIAGTVEIDHSLPLKDANGRISAYRVWVVRQ